MSKPFFFKAEKQQLDWYKTYSGKMHCFDDQIRLQGNYDTQVARTLAISFEKCDPTVRETCKSEEYISNWIKEKYFITAENTWVFRQDEYAASRKLSPHTFFYWQGISSVIRQEVSKLFTVHSIEFQDTFF